MSKENPALQDIETIRSKAALVHAKIPPTPQIEWPLLSHRLQCNLWLKHENYNPTGSFKVRGGLIYVSELLVREPKVKGVVAATRGNFGQSVAYASSQFGLPSVVVVPEGNSLDKNNLMQALGAEVITSGVDFDESIEAAKIIAEERRYHLIPSFHADLVSGVSSYALELFDALPDLNRIYVPIGLGSGICSVVNVRNALGMDCEIIGVVSENANAYQLSFDAGKLTSTNTAETIADGLAVRNPSKGALAIILDNVARIVSVSDEQIVQMIKFLFEDTHNIVEGAGAAAAAAALKEKDLNKGQNVAAILTGSNINKALFAAALME
ncbi:MAG: threonine dehydratase [Candidatus Azotimanducaceae bacterium]|jgi:threonine dehydratase